MKDCSMNCYELLNDVFVETPDPLGESSADINEALAECGYRIQVGNLATENYGAGVALYVCDNDRFPRYYIDLMGQEQAIGAMIARDFPQLVVTFTKLQGLLSLFRLDQTAVLHALDQSRVEYPHP